MTHLSPFPLQKVANTYIFFGNEKRKLHQGPILTKNFDDVRMIKMDTIDVERTIIVAYF